MTFREKVSASNTGKIKGNVSVCLQRMHGRLIANKRPAKANIHTHELVGLLLLLLLLLLRGRVNGGLGWLMARAAAAGRALARQHRHRVREGTIVVRAVGAHS